jgi:hypothetical protein
MLAGRYRIVAPLGRGGMGEIYRAEDTKLGQAVALKFLRGDLADDAELLQRLLAEVRIGREVSHPNVCRLYDVVDTSHHFIAMSTWTARISHALSGSGGCRRQGLGARGDSAGLAAVHDRASCTATSRPTP